MGKRDRALIGTFVVLRLPIADRDRAVEHFIAGPVAALERREIDEGLERRARLTLGVDGAVELAFVIVPASDQRANAAIERHGDECSLRCRKRFTVLRKPGFKRTDGKALAATQGRS